MSWPSTYFTYAIGDQKGSYEPLKTLAEALNKAFDAVLGEAEQATVIRVDEYEPAKPSFTPLAVLTKPTPKVVAP